MAPGELASIMFAAEHPVPSPPQTSYSLRPTHAGSVIPCLFAALLEGLHSGPRGVRCRGLLPGAGGGAVAVQDFGVVGVPGGGGAVGVQDQGPAPPVDHDLVVEKTQQDALPGAGVAAVGFVLDVVHLARGGGLVAAAGPAAVLVRGHPGVGV